MKLRTIICGIILLIFSIGISAQDNEIKILDFKCYPTEIEVSPGIISRDNVRLQINFKILKPNLASDVTINIGTTKNANDILSLTGSFVEISGRYVLRINGQDFKVRNEHELNVQTVVVNMQILNSIRSATISIMNTLTHVAETAEQYYD